MTRALAERPVSLARRPPAEPRRGWLRRRRLAPVAGLQAAKRKVRTYVRAVYEVTVVAPIVYLFSFVRAIVWSRSSHRIAIRSLIFGAIGMMCLGAALVAFGAFYYAWVPRVALTQNVWLKHGARRSALVLLDRSQRDWPVWQLEAPAPFFALDQEYDVDLQLRLPVNHANADLGNFMAHVSLETTDGQAIYTAYRTLLFVPEPSSVRWTQRAMRLLLARHSLEPVAAMQVMRVPMLSGIVPWASSAPLAPAPHDKGYEATYARVSVDHPDAQIEHVQLQFRARLHGIPYLMFHHPLAALAGMVGLFFAVAFSVAMAWWLGASVYFSTFA